MRPDQTRPDQMMGCEDRCEVACEGKVRRAPGMLPAMSGLVRMWKSVNIQARQPSRLRTKVEEDKTRRPMDCKLIRIAAMIVLIHDMS